MSDDLKALRSRVAVLETAVALLIGHARLDDQLEAALATKRDEAADRTEDRNAAMSQATRDAHAVNSRRARG